MPSRNKTYKTKSYSPKSKNVTMRNFLTRTDKAKSPSTFVYNPWGLNGGIQRADIEFEGRYNYRYPSSNEKHRIREKWGNRAKTARVKLNINDQLVPIGNFNVTRNSGNRRSIRHHSR